MTRHHLRLLLRAWHRRFGIVLALLVLLVAITGILINHADGWHLAGKPVRSGLVLAWYGIESPKIQSAAVADHWLSQVGGDRLFLDDRNVAYCTGSFAGAMGLDDGSLLAACGDELLQLTADGQLIERLGAVYGLPAPVTKLGFCDGRPCLESTGQLYGIDLVTPAWPPLAPSAFKPADLRAPPPALAKKLADHGDTGALDWERFLLDLHSGRLFGLGPWLMDLLAIGLILIAISGLCLWWLGGRPVGEMKPHRQKAIRKLLRDKQQ